MGLNPDKLKKTIAEYNEAVQPGKFDLFVLDGKRTKGLSIDKTNWAEKIERPPFISYPIECRVNFTYGGIKTDLMGRVLDTNGNPISGLYAVGEMTGLYHGKYLGGTSFLRSMVFGKIAGEAVVNELIEGNY
ncbi:MAG: FAD-binding protein [Nitrososphaerota archaeon]